MSRRLISASAGTGTTYRLVNELWSALVDTEHPVAPEHVVAVTFTRAAAAELEERVRRKLLAEEKIDLAHRLGAARIGTVHAVCQRLVEEMAFELGLAPELRTLNEGLAERALQEALSGAVSDEELALLDDLGQRMAGMRSWASLVRGVVDMARSHGLSPEQLRDARHASANRLRARLGTPDEDGATLDDELKQEVANFLARARASGEPGDQLQRDVRHARDAHEAFDAGRLPPWSTWLSLEGLKHRAGAPLKKVARAHVRHPQLHRDLMCAHNLVYEIAERALVAYQRAKQEWGVVDFVDMESYALRLLTRNELRARLAEEIELVLIDELQDSSPLQLAIFRALDEIATTSIWVGDQKQSIYGFRGADPELMQEIFREPSAARLTVSYRSRPALTRMTSAIFARAFSPHGISAADVHVESALGSDDEDLGPPLEYWRIADQEEHDRDAIAWGLAALLEDDSVRVRDRTTGTVRRLERGDVAVLVRTNRTARQLASAFARMGISAVLRRTGLCRTVEARVVAAGLRLLIDNEDKLAIAELTRALVHPTDDVAFMKALLAGERAFKVRGLTGEGVAIAVDHVIDALDLRNACARWPDSAQRLANLAALRALAVRYVDMQNAQGKGATLVGFVHRLEELRRRRLNDENRQDDEDDRMGDVAAHDTVEIATWHAAKGREWPVVVLAELDYRHEPTVFGVHAERDPTRPADVTAARWPRCWPNPYRDSQRRGGLHALLSSKEEGRRLAESHAREELRVLYVAWTRARDRLVLACRDGDFREAGRAIARLDLVPPTSTTHWANLSIPCVVRSLTKREPMARVSEEPWTYAARGRVEHPPAFIQPSAVEGAGEAGDPIVLGPQFVLAQFADEETMARLGSMVHAFFAADPRADDNARFALAERLVDRFEVRGLLDVGAVVEIADRVWKQGDLLWPGARIVRETPVTHRLENGSVVRGQIDLMFECDDGVAIIDHKTYAGVLDVRAHAAQFGGQLRAYANAVAASGKRVSSTWIHLPLSGVLVPVY